MLPLRTSRLVLETVREGDGKALFPVLSDEKANTFLPWFTLKTPSEAEAFVRERFLKQGLLAWKVVERESGEVVGYVDYGLDGARDLGYGFRSEVWGRGYATEACRAVVGHARETGVPFLTATHDRENPASGAVMRKLGMEYQYTYLERWMPKDRDVWFRLYLLNLDGDSSRKVTVYWDGAEVKFVEDTRAIRAR